MNYIKLIAVLLPFFMVSCKKHNEPTIKNFELLDKSITGIDFSNDLSYDNDFNVYKYRNFYNGGGVSVGDVNNDNLLDIYFTSNQNQNKLFLNKGDFKFFIVFKVFLIRLILFLFLEILFLIPPKFHLFQIQSYPTILIPTIC